mmetsp:Transcript_18710/g.29017  ORF Transcript_18710/g.29017 Transcript_18710/m.29017 type:complete len:352 (+) Transcript_18710:1011-2066(+)
MSPTLYRDLDCLCSVDPVEVGGSVEMGDRSVVVREAISSKNEVVQFASVIRQQQSSPTSSRTEQVYLQDCEVPTLLDTTSQQCARALCSGLSPDVIQNNSSSRSFSRSSSNTVVSVDATSMSLQHQMSKVVEVEKSVSRLALFGEALHSPYRCTTNNSCEELFEIASINYARYVENSKQKVEVWFVVSQQMMSALLLSMIGGARVMFALCLSWLSRVTHVTPATTSDLVELFLLRLLALVYLLCNGCDRCSLGTNPYSEVFRDSSFVNRKKLFVKSERCSCSANRHSFMVLSFEREKSKQHEQRTLQPHDISTQHQQIYYELRDDSVWQFIRKLDEQPMQPKQSNLVRNNK